jgi:hypothetical protein
MKRALKIVLILIFITAVVLLVFWLLARHKAVQTGTNSPSFKDFFTHSGTAGEVQNQNPDESQGSFTGTGTDNGTNDGAPGENGAATMSTFTNGTISPIGGIGGVGVGVDGIGGIGVGGIGLSIPGSDGGVIFGGDGTNDGDGNTNTTPTGTPADALPSVASCTEAETHIEFSPTDLARLQTLAKQFYSLATTLHSDADVASAQAAYDSFHLQDEQLNELIAYAQAHQIKDPTLNKRVATPFWEDDSALPIFIGSNDTHHALGIFGDINYGNGNPDIRSDGLHCGIDGDNGGADECNVAPGYSNSLEDNLARRPSEPIWRAENLLEYLLAASLW